jgi:alpha-galactosidase
LKTARPCVGEAKTEFFNTESSNLFLNYSPQRVDQTLKQQTGRHQPSSTRFISSLHKKPQTSIRDAGVAANSPNTAHASAKFRRFLV